MSGEAFVLGLLALITVLLSAVIWTVFATARARASAAHGQDCASCQRLATDVERLRVDVEQLRRTCRDR